MTRDKYDASGNIIQPGIKDSQGELGAKGDFTFVFDESVMDDPEYDSLASYPNAPRIPLDTIHAVLVANDDDISSVKKAFNARGIDTQVIARSDWLKRYDRVIPKNTF
jgi:hypothetical protein